MPHKPDGGNKIGKISAGQGGRVMEKAGFYEGGLYIYMYIYIYMIIGNAPNILSGKGPPSEAIGDFGQR